MESWTSHSKIPPMDRHRFRWLAGGISNNLVTNILQRRKRVDLYIPSQNYLPWVPAYHTLLRGILLLRVFFCWCCKVSISIDPYSLQPIKEQDEGMDGSAAFFYKQVKISFLTFQTNNFLESLTKEEETKSNIPSSWKVSPLKEQTVRNGHQLIQISRYNLKLSLSNPPLKRRDRLRPPQ